MNRPWKSLVLALALAAPGVEAWAQAALINGGFDTELAGWTLETSNPDLDADWASEDASGSAASGSVELRDALPGNGGIVWPLSQCVELAGSSFPIPVAAQARVLAGGEPQVQAWISYKEYDAAGCQSHVGYQRDRLVNNNDANWLAFSESFTPAGAGTQSVAVRLGIGKGIGTGVGGAVRFDEVVFGAAVDAARLKRWTIDAGGGRAAGGGIVLTGSIGQPEPGSASGGGLSLQSGFWHAAGGAPPSGDSIFRNGFE